jgi:hypothetical protein
MSQQPPFDKKSISEAIKDAEKEGTKFNPRERAQYVRERVEEARRLRALGQNDEQIKAALGDFVDNYPQLFQMAMSPSYSPQRLNVMLQMLDRMAGGMTQHQASVAIGQILANQYIKPVVDKTPPDRLPK